ncbi:diguanylate cyclase [Brachionus plicatilis]|uniref:Diguanylate cyclase n=1 Tax=Brachionus plicatilis TaxID=10195 RepID=A0A3M7QXZ0_BRAPC|nr:diguanylate cyclase [Brachionus plicatilis]
MPESIKIAENSSKQTKYFELIPQIKSLIENEKNLYANLANISAALKQVFNFWWVGFYLVDSESEQELVLGPFQGPIACTRIKSGRGVCGASWKEQKTFLVPDVDKFPGHIACSSLSRSEIVVPIFGKDGVIGVLDVDSEFLDNFDSIDQQSFKSSRNEVNKNFALNGELQSNSSYIPLVNGCGSDGFRIDFSEKKFHLFNMCCNAHDLCYGTCGTNKIECDLNFKNCLESVCELLKNNSKHDCIFNGKMMYGLVTIFGCENFQESQTTACICK